MWRREGEGWNVEMGEGGVARGEGEVEAQKGSASTDVRTMSAASSTW